MEEFGQIRHGFCRFLAEIMLTFARVMVVTQSDKARGDALVRMLDPTKQILEVYTRLDIHPHNQKGTMKKDCGRFVQKEDFSTLLIIDDKPDHVLQEYNCLKIAPMVYGVVDNKLAYLVDLFKEMKKANINSIRMLKNKCKDLITKIAE